MSARVSFDTNILLYALNADCTEHQVARELLAASANSADVVISELVLVELYLLLRNSRVLTTPLSAADAVSVCTTWRTHPRWRTVDGADVMDDVWPIAASAGFARRRIIDARLAFSLLRHGVDTLYTRNTRDFAGFGLTVVDPFAAVDMGAAMSPESEKTAR